MVSSKLESSNEKNGTDEHSDKADVVKVKSDDIVAELLREVCNSDKPFCLEDIAPKQVVKEKKKKHKHKKSKKKRRHESRSRSRSRSPSKRSRKSKRRSRSRSSTDTWKSKSPELIDRNSKDVQVLLSPNKHIDIKSTLQQVSDDDDDLPVGADFRTVMREAKMTINIRHPNEKPLDLSLLPSNPGCSVPKHLIKSFPLSKDAKKLDEDDVKPIKKESDVLMKVIASKGKGDFVPRNLKVKSSTTAVTVTSTPSFSVLPPNPISALDKDEAAIPSLNEFGPAAPVLEELKEDPNSISDSELERRIEMELAEEIKPRKAETEKWTKLIENSVAAIDRKNETLTKSKPTRKSRSKSSSCDTDNEIRLKANSSKYRSSRKHRSRSRSRGDGRKNRDIERKRRSVSRSRNNRSRSRTRRSRSRSRRRSSGSRSHRRSSRSRSRPRKSRSRSKERSRRRSRSRDRRHRDSSFDGIDKAKLLEIARKKAQGDKTGTGKDGKEFNPRSVNDFVSYCEKIQRRQEKEDRREKGEQVSSDGELSEEETPSFKHPYGVKPADAIKINIANSVPLPTKSTQECILDSSQLRIVFPVSSGSVHKNHKDSSEWTRVEKVEAPVTCSTDQKKFVAVTSLGAEKARQTGNVMNLHGPMVPLTAPPPPSSRFVLPPPPPPPKITAFDMLLPLPPPLPPTLLVPRRQDMVMREPESVDREAPRDVSRVLAQRARAQRALAENPNNYEAIRSLKDADEQMSAWDASRNAPGKFTGSTGVNILRPEDLQPQDPRFHAWTRKDSPPQEQNLEAVQA